MITNPNIPIYQANNRKIKINVKFEDRILWLSQIQICEVFGKTKLTIINFIEIANYLNILSDTKEPNSYNSLNTPLPPLIEVPTKGFSS